MIFIFTDVKVGFCYSFDGVNQKKNSRTPTIFSRMLFRENFHGHFLHFTGTFQDFFTDIPDFHEQKPTKFDARFFLHGVEISTEITPTLCKMTSLLNK